MNAREQQEARRRAQRLASEYRELQERAAAAAAQERAERAAEAAEWVDRQKRIRERYMADVQARLNGTNGHKSAGLDGWHAPPGDVRVKIMLPGGE